MNVFDKTLLIRDRMLFLTMVAFIGVWWCLTYSLLSSYHSTYEAVLDPIIKLDKYRELYSHLSRAGNSQLHWFAYLIHNYVVRSSSTTPLIFCLYPVAQYQLPMLCQMLMVIMSLFNIKILCRFAIKLLSCGMGCAEWLWGMACAEWAVNTCTQRIHKTTMAEIWATELR